MIDEVRRDLGLLLEPIRAFEVVERAAVVAELVEHPAHAVDDRRAVGVHRERSLDVAAGFCVSVELIRQQISERVQAAAGSSGCLSTRLSSTSTARSFLPWSSRAAPASSAASCLAVIALRALTEHRARPRRAPGGRCASCTSKHVELDVRRAQAPGRRAKPRARRRKASSPRRGFFICSNSWPARRACPMRSADSLRRSRADGESRRPRSFCSANMMRAVRICASTACVPSVTRAYDRVAVRKSFSVSAMRPR